MLEKHASVLVGVSGGIDSMVLLFLLLKYNEKYAQKWSIKAAHINEGFPDWDPDLLEEYLLAQNVQFVIAGGKINDRIRKVEDKCFFCSRARRKKLMEIAEGFDIFNIALAHHQEDVVETLLLNMLFTGRMGTLLPMQPIVRGRFTVVRPLYYMDKKIIVEIAQAMGLKSFGNPCPYYADSRREMIRQLLNQIEKKNPDIYTNIFHSIFDINKPYMP
ncbi:MAG: tRNA 2-thiocytidine biosynthesis TtcA family protein [candidate division WOR-3 bacterium]|nr:tRNA 2-thiocytidine biosynthesis TtcA family protein [candidate division WOR-3 bacterium]